MPPKAQKLFGHWFLEGVYGHITKNGYFHCFVPSCPYSVKLRKENENDPTPTVFEEVVFGLHCHEFPERKAVENKRMIKAELKAIESGQDVENVLANKHKRWQEMALQDNLDVKEDIVDKKAIVDYACRHLHLSGRRVLQNTKRKMTRRAVGMARLREMEKRGEATKIEDLIRQKTHHLLKNDGKDILIFGLKSAVKTMATTDLILADGTFRCVLPKFTQLYVLHAVVKNNVAIPMFFCLLNGKKREIYTRLLRLVEELAEENGTTIFRRPVTLMCDFEAPFIKTVQALYESVKVKCCFFHFVKNIRIEGQPIVKTIERAAGKTSEAYRLAQKTKRRLMMLPLLPEELAIPEVLGLIHCAWTDACPEHRHAFDGLVAKVIKTYVGTPPGDPARVRPQFNQSIWSVSGMSVRTNNGAESLHAQLNAEVEGRLALFGFLSIIEGQMMRGIERIRTGCESESRPVEQVKNEMLAQELHKLLNGEEGVLAFLDNCASIT